MPKVLLALAVAVLAAGPLGCSSPRTANANTPEGSAVMAQVRQFVDSFNAGDTAKALSACTDQMSIIDEFPPFEWHGSGALSKWFADYDANAKKDGITDGKVTLADPLHVDIAGEYAYVVSPADYAFEQKGKPVEETGSLFTFALHKGASGWRITGWSWSKN